MADDEQFSLCWNNFNSNLSAGFHESLCRGDLVDVTLAAEGQFVKAHRLVLSVCSPYFRKMFTQMPANQHAFVFLKDVSHTALKDLIQFMYCGEVNVKQEALPAFISTAEALQIKGLTDSDPPPSQSPAEPSTPTPQVQQISSPRVRQRSSTARSYKLETVDDSGDDNKQPTQIVIQTSAPAPQTTIAQQTQHLQPQSHQSQHTAQQLGSAGTTAPTIATQKRSAQRNSSGAPHIKRTKSTIDPLDTDTTGTTPPQTQQITVQSAVVTAESKTHLQQQQSETEYIDLPIELPTKSEPDYTEDAGEVESAEPDATYVEDDSYGELRYDESYFTENEDAAANTTGGAAPVGSATTSKAIVKQQQTSFSDSSYVETSDHANSDAQAKILNKYCHRSQAETGTLEQKKYVFGIKPIGAKKKSPSTTSSSSSLKTTKTTRKLDTKVNIDSEGTKRNSPSSTSTITQCFKSPENIVKTSANNHHLTIIKKTRLRGKCVHCLKKLNNSDAPKENLMKTLKKIITYCPECPGGVWMCESCFDELHV